METESLKKKKLRKHTNIDITFIPKTYEKDTDPLPCVDTCLGQEQ